MVSGSFFSQEKYQGAGGGVLLQKCGGGGGGGGSCSKNAGGPEEGGLAPKIWTLPTNGGGHSNGGFPNYPPGCLLPT